MVTAVGSKSEMSDLSVEGLAKADYRCSILDFRNRRETVRSGSTVTQSFLLFTHVRRPNFRSFGAHQGFMRAKSKTAAVLPLARTLKTAEIAAKIFEHAVAAHESGAGEVRARATRGPQISDGA